MLIPFSFSRLVGIQFQGIFHIFILVFKLLAVTLSEMERKRLHEERETRNTLSSIQCHLLFGGAGRGGER